MFPATGSTMIAARPSPYRATAAAAASTSLYGQTIVSCAAPVGTPGDAGIPSVASPEPARGEQRVGVAVVAAGELEDPVAARERRGRAGSRSSRPRSRRRRAAPSRPTAPRRRSRRRARPRASVGAPKRRPARGRLASPPRPSPGPRARRSAAPTTSPSRGSGGRRRPRSRRPRRARTNSGSSSPTARIARTGELTPPGISSSARR